MSQHEEMGENENTKRESSSIPDTVEHPSDIIGEWGPMQRAIMICLLIIYIVAPFNNIHIVFTAPNADFYCVDTDPKTNLQVNLTNSCKIGNQSDSPVCTKFDHDRSFHLKTLVNTFDLVCDKAWYPSFAQSCHQFGYAVSGILLGIISDRYGRFFCAKLAITLEILAGFGQAFSPDIYVYFFTRFLVGVAGFSRFLNGHVLLAEWVGPKIRGKMSIIYEVGWLVGEMLLPWAYYFVPDYVTVQVAVTCFEIIVFIGYIFVIKESPRWQMTHGRYEEAQATLKKAALEKGILSETEIDRRIQLLKEYTIREEEELKQQKMNKLSLLDFFKDPKLLKITVILCYSRFCLALIGYGSFLNIGNLGGSLHMNVFFGSISSVVSNIIMYFLIQRMDRRTLMQTGIVAKCFSLLGLLCCSFHDVLIPGRILFYNLSSIAGWLTLITMYIYITEFFPTTMRQTAHGICSFFARVGSVIAPFVKELTLATSLAVPVALFVFLAATCAFLWIFLPDTTDIELPDTILQTKRVEEEAAIQHNRKLSRMMSIKSNDLEMKER